jgi:hypothetical protein
LKAAAHAADEGKFLLFFHFGAISLFVSQPLGHKVKQGS